MPTLVITGIFGLALAYFATLNTGVTSLNLGGFTLESVPMYLVILIPPILALIVSYLISLIKDLSSNLTISEQKDEIKNLKNENAELIKRVHKLELENTKIKAENGEAEDENSI